MSSYAVARGFVLTLIEPEAHVRYLAFWLPREPLAELLVKGYGAAHLALTEQHLAGVGQGLRLERLSRYCLA